MYISDEDYFYSLKNVFSMLQSLFTKDVLICLTDREKYRCIDQAKTFKLNIHEGMSIVKGGDSEKAISTGQKQSVYYPKETFGFPVKSYTIPVINESTGNILGTVTYAISQEKENGVIEMAAELKSYAEQMSASAQELSSSSQEMYSNGQSINNLVNETQMSINKMDDILKYVANIAETTNLIGLNAAIEAARAGEYGRGFSVVAQEIRKLASNSKTSAVDIKNALEKIKNDIGSILEFIDTLSGASAGQAAHAEQLASSSGKLNELSSNMLKIAEDLND